MDKDFFDADDFDGTDDDFADGFAEEGDCLDEDWLDRELADGADADEDPEDGWDEEAIQAEADGWESPVDEETRRREQADGFDTLDAMILGTMVAGVAGDEVRRTRRRKRGSDRT